MEEARRKCEDNAKHKHEQNNQLLVINETEPKGKYKNYKISKMTKHSGEKVFITKDWTNILIDCMDHIFIGGIQIKTERECELEIEIKGITESGAKDIKKTNRYTIKERRKILFKPVIVRTISTRVFKRNKKCGSGNIHILSTL